MSEPRYWILLRGLARGQGHWGSFVEELKKKFPQDQFELIDIPGNGTRVGEDSPLSMADYVRQVRSKSRFIREGKKVRLLAISLGGMIATEWMREYPLEIEKAYLMCTSAGNFSPMADRFMFPNYIQAAKLFTYHKDGKKWESCVLGMVANSEERKSAEIPGMISFTNQYPVRRQNVLRQLVAASRFKFPNEAPGDVVLLGSHGDRLVSPRCTLEIGKRWGIHPIMHPWAGHDIPVDDPQWVVEHLL